MREKTKSISIRSLCLIIIVVFSIAFEEPASAQTCRCELLNIKCTDDDQTNNVFHRFTIEPDPVEFTTFVGKKLTKVVTLKLRDEIINSPSFFRTVGMENIPHEFELRNFSIANPFEFKTSDDPNCSDPKASFQIQKSFCLEFDPTRGGTLRRNLEWAFLRDTNTGCMCICKETFTITGTGIDVDIVPKEVHFLVDPNDPLFPTGRPQTFRIKVVGADVQLMNIQLLDENGDDLLNAAPFEVGGLPSSAPIIKDAQELTFTLRPVVPSRGGATLLSFRGTMRIVIRNAKITDDLLKDVPISLNVTPGVLTVPTLNQWGMLILSLLVMALGLTYIIKRHSMLAQYTQADIEKQIDMNPEQRRFALRMLYKPLVITLLLLFVGILVVTKISGPFNIIDVAGMLICPLILAYIISLLSITIKLDR